MLSNIADIAIAMLQMWYGIVHYVDISYLVELQQKSAILRHFSHIPYMDILTKKGYPVNPQYVWGQINRT